MPHSNRDQNSIFKAMPTDVTSIGSSRRILAVAAPGSGILSLLQDLTGSAPEKHTESTAGLSHTWKLTTSYYTVDIPIWIDEIAHVGEWKADFSKPDAKEVVQVVGAWLFCFRKPITEGELSRIKDTLSAIDQVLKSSCGYEWDGVLLAVALPQSIIPNLQLSFEDWEDVCRDFGFEYVDSEAKGRNEYGEMVGVARVREALEANEWSLDETSQFEEMGFPDDDEANEGDFLHTFAAEEAEMGMELADMKTAILNNERSDSPTGVNEMHQQVEELGKMMGSLQAIKEKGAHMSKTAREKFAAKAVDDLMKNI